MMAMEEQYWRIEDVIEKPCSLESAVVLQELDQQYSGRDDEAIIGLAATEFAADACSHLDRYKPLVGWFSHEIGVTGNVKHAIDFGCGPAVLTDLMAQALPNVQITGIDLSDDMISIARTRETDRLHIVHGDAREGGQIAQSPAGAAISRRMLHRADGLESMIDKMAQSVSVDGILMNFSFRRPTDDDSIRLFLEAAQNRSEFPALHEAFVKAVLNAPTLTEYGDALKNVAHRLDAKRCEIRVFPFDIAFLIAR